MDSQSDPNNHKLDISFALSANAPERVSALIQAVAALGLDPEANRAQLLNVARGLVAALETPQETMIHHMWVDGTKLAVLATGVEIGLFKHMAKSDKPQKVVDIASAISIEQNLLARLLRYVASMGYLIETGPDEYKPTRFSKALSIPQIGDPYPQEIDTIFPVLSKMPEYINDLGLNKLEPGQGLFQVAYGTDKTFFEFLHSKGPRSLEQFHHAQGGFQYNQARWFDSEFYPVKDLLIMGAKTTPCSDGGSPVFLVDVAGGTGRDIERFHEAFPNVPGRLILQDLPNVLENVNLGTRIELMAMDLFDKQPVIGARAYYLHSSLHDWSDDQCHTILTRLRQAMTPGYSKLLIHESVILSTGNSRQTTAMDILMFVLNGSAERTEGTWHSLLDGAGLKLCKIWSTPRSLSSLIECEVAE